MPWPEPDFFRINVVAQDGALVGSGLDSDGSVAVHTVECGTVVVAYERYARCVVGVCAGSLLLVEIAHAIRVTNENRSASVRLNTENALT